MIPILGRHGSCAFVGRILISAALLLAVALPGSAPAQTAQPLPDQAGPDWSSVPHTTQGMFDAIRSQVLNQGATGAPLPLVPTAPAVDAGRYSVGSDPGVSDQMLAEFLNTVRAGGGDGTAVSVAEVFRQKPVRAAFREAAGPYGLSDQDLRDALTGFLVMGWLVANEVGLPTTAQVQGVRRQVDAALSQKPLAADARQRQVLAEYMMYRVVALIYARQEGQQTGNAQALRQMADQTAAAFLAQNMDLRGMVLTDQGFAPR